MARYTEAFRQQVVQAYLSSTTGSTTLARQYGIGSTTLERWVASYREHGEPGLRAKYERYSAQFKQSAVQYLREHGLSYAQVCTVFDIRDPKCLSLWTRQYDEGELSALQPRRRVDKMPITPPPPCPPTPANSEDSRSREELLKENEYLRAEVAFLKKLDEMQRQQEQAAASRKVQKRRKP